MPRIKRDENQQDTDLEAVVETKTFPITLYKVSKEWINNLYLEMKRTIMSQALETECPKEFLDALNGLELHFSDLAEISLEYHKKGAKEAEKTVIHEAVFQENLASAATTDEAVEAATEEVAQGAAEQAAEAAPAAAESAEAPKPAAPEA